MVGENRQFVTIDEPMVQDDLNLPDDGGEIPKSQGRGWQFESRSLYLMEKLVRCLTASCALVLTFWPSVSKKGKENPHFDNKSTFDSSTSLHGETS